MSEPVLDHPICIVGAPRSGTTILYRILSSHPEVLGISEPRLVWRWGNDSRSDLLRPEDATEPVRHHIRSYFANVVADAGRRRLVEKTPANSLRIPFIDRVLPEALFVHIMRNGVDSILSMRDNWDRMTVGPRTVKLKRWRQRFAEASLRQVPFYAAEALRRLLPRRRSGISGIWGPRIPGLEAMRRDLTTLEIACLQWRMCVDLCRGYGRALPSGRYLEAHLEDLDREGLGRILDFCELDFHDDVLDEFRSTFDNHDSSHWRRSARPEEIELIERWAGPTLDASRPRAASAG